MIIIETESEDSAFADTLPINETVMVERPVVAPVASNTEDSEDDIRQARLRRRNGRQVINPFIGDEGVNTTTKSECKYTVNQFESKLRTCFMAKKCGSPVFFPSYRHSQCPKDVH